MRAFLHIQRWGAADGGLDPLLNRIARNLLIDRYRRATPHIVPLDSAGDIHDPEQDPTEEVARRQRRRAVHHAIRELPSRHQRAINYSLSGMTPEEVGRQLGIGRNAADALLHRARRTLREHLAPVRDGMWGLAIAVRIRYDRFMRRAGVRAGVADASQLNALQSGITIATAAVVGVLGVSGVFGATPAAASVFAGLRARAVSSVTSGPATSTTGGTTSGGSSIAGGSSGMDGGSISLGAASAGGSWGYRHMNAHASVPGNRSKESPLVGLGVTSYPDPGNNYEGPGAALVNPGLDVLCSGAPLHCGGGS